MFRVTIILFLSWTASAQGKTVVFCAPPELRAAVSAELTAQGREPLDLSDLDNTLFGPGGAKGRVAAGKPVTLPATLPKELRADFAKGQAGCRGRGKQEPDDQAACAEHLVGAVWERHLARLHPERVIEIKTEEGAVSMATYLPGDATIAGAMVHPDSPANLAKGLVHGALSGRLPGMGGRPSTNILPGPTPPPVADLSQGSPQSLTALEVPKGCMLPSELAVEPANAPLAVTVGTLWRATVAGHVKEGAEPGHCSLDLMGPAVHPSGLTFGCGSELFELGLFAGTQFGDATFQAALARVFVSQQVQARCR
jgi:hypothetical protein